MNLPIANRSRRLRADTGSPFKSDIIALISEKKKTLSLLTIVLLGTLLYSNIYGAPFVFDDIKGITSNAAITSFHNLLNGSNYQRLVGFFTLALNYRLTGLNNASYHFFNILIHLINALLIFYLVLAVFDTPLMKGSINASKSFLIALFSSLIFVAHPIQTEAVTYTIQRFASLAALFFFLTILAYAKWRAEPARLSAGGGKPKLGRRQIYYIVALASAMLAMGSKETAFTLPLILAMWEFFFYAGPRLKRCLRLAPFAVISLWIPASVLLSDKPLLAGDGATPPPPALHYLYTQFPVIVTYIRLLLFPVRQNIDYDYPVYSSFFDVHVFLSFLFLLLAVTMAGYLYFHSRKKGQVQLRLIAFGIVFFFITLSVESSIIPITDVIFEHRVYLPSAGFIIAFVSGIVFFGSSLKQRAPAAAKLMIPALIMIVAVLGIATVARNNVWSSTISLWTDAVQKSPGKARPHINLGLAYEQFFMVNQAQQELEKGVSIRPDSAALYELGMVYETEYRLPQAQKTFIESLKLNPAYPDAHFELGSVYLDEKRPQDAKKEFLSALSYRPDYAQALNSLGVIAAQAGDYAGAVSRFQQSVDSDPTFALAYNNLGLGNQKLGNLEAAVTDFQEAIHQKDGYADAYANLGKTYEQMRRYDDAVRALLQAIEINANSYKAHLELGNVYRLQHLTAESRAEYQKTLQINPNDATAKAGLSQLDGSL